MQCGDRARVISATTVGTVRLWNSATLRANMLKAALALSTDDPPIGRHNTYNRYNQ